MSGAGSGSSESGQQAGTSPTVDERKRRTRAIVERTILIGLGLVCGVLGFLSFQDPTTPLWVPILFGVGALALILFGAFANAWYRGLVIRGFTAFFLTRSLAFEPVSAILDKWQAEVKVEVQKAEATDSQLDFATLWSLTQDQMNTYHKIATKQADQSFRACQVAMIVGLLLIIGFGITAVLQKDPIAAAAAGAISVLSGAVSAYISATFMRAYTEATAQMRQFFVQPADFTRLLGAERLIATIGSDVHKTEAVKIVLQSMSFESPFAPTDKSQDTKKPAAKSKRSQG